jgi:hypothetical protein
MHPAPYQGAMFDSSLNSSMGQLTRARSQLLSIAMIASAIISLLSASVVLTAVWRVIFGPPSAARVIREMGEAATLQIRAMQGQDPESLLASIKRLEHELMIAGHEFECEICIENSMTLRQKAIRAMKERWGV